MTPTTTHHRLADYEKRYHELAAQLATIGLIRSGGVTHGTPAARPPAANATPTHPQPHGPYYQWTAKVNGKTVTRHLDHREAALYQEWIANDRQLQTHRPTDAPSRRQSDRAQTPTSGRPVALPTGHPKRAHKRPAPAPAKPGKPCKHPLFMAPVRLLQPDSRFF